MIIYDDRIKPSLIKYGIEIPISNSKSEKSFNYLASHPVLKKSIDRWHIKEIKESLTKEDLLRVHSKEYVERLYSDKLEDELIRAYELIDKNGKLCRYNPGSATQDLSGLFFEILQKASGTYQCALTALDKKFCFFFGGGMHHAKREYGEGFCLINDIVIALRRLQAEKKIKNGCIIDVDAHKGDGTASLTHNDQSIKTLSIHMAKGWPLDQKEYDEESNLNPSFIPSDIDIPIKKGEEPVYNKKLREGMKELLESFKADIAIVVLGSDPYEKDELESAKDLKLTLEELKERDLNIYNFLKEKEIPQAYLMAGGYGESSWRVYSRFLETVLLEYYS